MNMPWTWLVPVLVCAYLFVSGAIGAVVQWATECSWEDGVCVVFFWPLFGVMLIGLLPVLVGVITVATIRYWLTGTWSWSVPRLSADIDARGRAP